jgi:hypothetical protein
MNKVRSAFGRQWIRRRTRTDVLSRGQNRIQVDLTCEVRKANWKAVEEARWTGSSTPVLVARKTWATKHHKQRLLSNTKDFSTLHDTTVPRCAFLGSCCLSVSRLDRTETWTEQLRHTVSFPAHAQPTGGQPGQATRLILNAVSGNWCPSKLGGCNPRSLVHSPAAK